MNGTFSTPAAVKLLVMTGGVGRRGPIVRTKFDVPVPSALVAPSKTLKEPASIGVP